MTLKDYIKLGGVTIATTTGAFFLVKIYKAASAKVSENKELKDYKKEIQHSMLRFTEAEYKSMADRIYVALNQTWDDNEETIYSILKQFRSKHDWYKLISVFGVRKRTKAYFVSSINGTLPQWFEDTLSDSERDKVRDILSTIGVAY